MLDTMEEHRRKMVDAINNPSRTREEWEAEMGRVYDTAELCAHFKISHFLAPFVVVERKSDGQKGTLWFQHDPRLYFGFQSA